MRKNVVRPPRRACAFILKNCENARSPFYHNKRGRTNSADSYGAALVLARRVSIGTLMRSGTQTAT